VQANFLLLWENEMRKSPRKDYFFVHGWRAVFTVDTFLLVFAAPFCFWGLVDMALPSISPLPAILGGISIVALLGHRIFRAPIRYVAEMDDSLLYTFSILGIPYQEVQIPYSSISNAQVMETTCRGVTEQELILTLSNGSVYTIKRELFQSRKDFDTFATSILNKIGAPD
jgi:hypothetical protein